MTWHKLMEHPIKPITTTCHGMYCKFPDVGILYGFITEPGSNSRCSIIDSITITYVIQMWLFCCRYVPAIYHTVSEIYENDFLLYNTANFTKLYWLQHPIAPPWGQAMWCLCNFWSTYYYYCCSVVWNFVLHWTSLKWELRVFFWTKIMSYR